MKNLQRWIFIGAIILAFQSYAFAQNWYAVSTVEAIFKDGSKERTSIVTKVPDKDTCERVLLEKCYSAGNSKCVEKKCASGRATLGSAKKSLSKLTYDEFFRNVFNKKPVSSVYLYFIDVNGFATVINLLSSQNSIIPLAKFMAEQAEKGGAKSVKVVYPQGMRKLNP